MITDTMRWEPAANSSCASQGLSVVIPTMGRAARSRNVVHMGRALLASHTCPRWRARSVYETLLCDNDPPRDPAVLTVRVRQSGRVVVHV